MFTLLTIIYTIGIFSGWTLCFFTIKIRPTEKKPPRPPPRKRKTNNKKTPILTPTAPPPSPPPDSDLIQHVFPSLFNNGGHY